jgi:hypothetical protein
VYPSGAIISKNATKLQNIGYITYATTMKMTTFQERARLGFETGIRETGGKLQVASRIPAWANGVSGLDVLQSVRPDSNGFRPVDVGVADYLKTPGLLGRVVLYETPRGMMPTTLLPVENQPTKVKVSIARLPYIPSKQEKLSDGQLFVVSVETMTAEASGFGSHGLGQFEAGHFTVASLAATNRQFGQELRAKGHGLTHEVIDDSVSTRLRANGLVAPDVPLPETKIIDTADPNYQNVRLPLYWTDSFVDEHGAISATYQDTARLLVGETVVNLGSQGLDGVGAYVEQAGGR